MSGFARWSKGEDASGAGPGPVPGCAAGPILAMQVRALSALHSNLVKKMNTKYKILTYGYDPQGRETIGVCNADDELDAKDDALREVCLLDAYKAEIYVLSRVFVDGKHVEVYELIKTYIKK